MLSAACLVLLGHEASVVLCKTRRQAATLASIFQRTVASGRSQLPTDLVGSDSHVLEDKGAVQEDQVLGLVQVWGEARLQLRLQRGVGGVGEGGAATGQQARKCLL